MPFNTKCPAGHSLAVPSRFAGKQIACPKCKVNFTAVAVESESEKEKQAPIAAAVVVAAPIVRPTKSAPSSEIPPPPTVETAKPVEPLSVGVAPVTATKVSPPPAPPPIDAPPPPPPVDVVVQAEPILAEAIPASAVPSASPPTENQPKRSLIPKRTAAMAFQRVSTAAKKILASAVDFSEAQPNTFEHRIEKIHASYLLSAVVIGLAIFSTVPAWFDVLEHFQSGKSRGIAVWAYVLFFVGGMQCVYAIYVWQLPDWSSTWVITSLTLLLAMLYAMAFGSLLIGAEDSGLVQFLELQDRLQTARLWCVCVLGLTSLVAYFGGRMSARWRHDFLLESGHLN